MDYPNDMVAAIGSGEWIPVPRRLLERCLGASRHAFAYADWDHRKHHHEGLSPESRWPTLEKDLMQLLKDSQPTPPEDKP